jgi:hypothetical protein
MSDDVSVLKYLHNIFSKYYLLLLEMFYSLVNVLVKVAFNWSINGVSTVSMFGDDFLLVFFSSNDILLYVCIAGDHQWLIHA